MNQIKLTQSPVIVHQFIKAGEEVAIRIAELNLENQVVTIDTIKTLKSLRAELNKEKAAIDKDVKLALSPVTDAVDAVKLSYKENILTQYKNAENILKDKIGLFEIKIKDEKKANIERYFIELCQVEKIDFLKFEQLNLTIDLSTTEKKYKEKCNEFILKVQDDIKLIESDEFQAEIMAEYKLTLNSSKAITTVRDRKAKENEEKERILLRRTSDRESTLRKWGMAYHDMTKTFILSIDDLIIVKQSDIETFSNEDFQSKCIVLDLRIKEAKAKIQKANDDKLQKAADLANPDAIAKPLKEENKPAIKPDVVIPVQEVKKPLESPKEIIKEEVFEASFEVSGTMAQLKALGEYMKSNNITYKNI